MANLGFSNFSACNSISPYCLEHRNEDIQGFIPLEGKVSWKNIPKEMFLFPAVFLF